MSRGECDKLSNDNKLVSAGRSGNVVELSYNNEVVWHLNVKDHNNTEVSIFRAERIPSLYPNMFSFDINNLHGSYENYYIFKNITNCCDIVVQ